MQDGRGGSDLRSYLRVLRRRKTYIILAVVAVLAGALGVSLVQRAPDGAERAGTAQPGE